MSHPTTLVKRRGAIGTEGIEKVFSILIDSALRVGLVNEKSLVKMMCDTTVMSNAITYPTEAKIYYKSIVELNQFGPSFAKPSFDKAIVSLQNRLLEKPVSTRIAGK